MSSDDLVVWERAKTRESALAYHAFCHFRDLGPPRSVDKAWRQHRTVCDQIGLNQVSGRRPTTWANWSAVNGWMARAEAFDRDLDRQAREQFAAEVLAVQARHRRTLQGALTVLTVPTRAVIETLGQPGMMARLTALAATDRGLLALLALARNSIAGMPAIVAAERTAFGLLTATIAVQAGAAPTTPGWRVAADAGAVDLAIELLDRLASPGKSDGT